MGTSAEAALCCFPVVHAVLERLPIEDLFNCARYSELWELVAIAQLSEKLGFFVLLQNDFGQPASDRALTEELQWRLVLAQKAHRQPAAAIVFCTDRLYEAEVVAACFADGTSVVQVYVPCPIWVQRIGVLERRSAGLCVLVLFEHRPGVELRSEWLPCFPRLPRVDQSAVAAHFANARRRRYRLTSKVTYRHRETGQPAHFALYASTAFNRTTFRRPPSLYHVASCVLWTTCLKVLKHPPVGQCGHPVCWGTMAFGEKTRATSIRYHGSATDLQVCKHLDRVRSDFGDLDDALVLLSQEETLNVSAIEAIWNSFNDAAIVLGIAAGSLALDVNQVAFNLEPCGDDGNPKHLERPIVIAVYGAI